MTFLMIRLQPECRFEASLMRKGRILLTNGGGSVRDWEAEETSGGGSVVALTRIKESES